MNDLVIAKRYVNKAKQAKRDGIEFDLPFTTFKNMMRATKCGYTGLKLTFQDDRLQKSTDLTIDRIDNSKGYVPGNVKAVCFAANQLKSLWEDPSNNIDMRAIKRMIKVIENEK